MINRHGGSPPFCDARCQLVEGVRDHVTAGGVNRRIRGSDRGARLGDSDATPVALLGVDHVGQGVADALHDGLGEPVLRARHAEHGAGETEDGHHQRRPFGEPRNAGFDQVGKERDELRTWSQRRKIDTRIGEDGTARYLWSQVAAVLKLQEPDEVS